MGWVILGGLHREGGYAAAWALSPCLWIRLQQTRLFIEDVIIDSVVPSLNSPSYLQGGETSSAAAGGTACVKPPW